MSRKKVLLFFVFQTAAVFAADETPAFFRSSYFRTLENKQVEGYVVKRFDSPSLLSCGQQCMRNEWCTSTNYKMSSKKEGKGTCELNKHDISLVNENINFHYQQGVTFSMFLKVNKMCFIFAMLQEELPNLFLSFKTGPNSTFCDVYGMRAVCLLFQG